MLFAKKIKDEENLLSLLHQVQSNLVDLLLSMQSSHELAVMQPRKNNEEIGSLPLTILLHNVTDSEKLL